MTSLYGLAGFPLGHSFSRDYFTKKFTREKIDARYFNFELENIQDILQIIEQTPELKGFNVTIPHKQNIIPLLNEISDEAQEIGAVNCVKVTHPAGKPFLSGYNTDAYGFRKALLHFIPDGINKALILGNGGAAKAVRYVLKNLGMEVLTVSRTPIKASEISYCDTALYLKDFRLIVNTTPLGTWPKTDNYPAIPYSLLSSGHYLFDLVYNPEITAFMQQGIAAGAHACNGLEMLHGQAEKAWEIFSSENEIIK